MIGAAPPDVSPYNPRLDLDVDLDLDLESDADYNRLCWHSRRGMLELDLMLGPFVRDCYPGLDAEDQLRYRRLLECEDQDLYSWFLRRCQPQDEELQKIVERILAYTRPGN